MAEPEPEKEPEPEAEPEPEPEPEPKVKVKEESIEISEVVQFASGSAVLLPESEKLLDEVAAAMKDHPEILRVRSRPHRARPARDKPQAVSRARSIGRVPLEQGVPAGDWWLELRREGAAGQQQIGRALQYRRSVQDLQRRKYATLREGQPAGMRLPAAHSITPSWLFGSD